MTTLGELAGRAASVPAEDPHAWLELLEEAIDADPEALPLLAAIAPRNPVVARALAFTLATRTHDLSETRWLVAAALLCSPESVADPSTATNLITWLTRELAENAPLPALVRRAAGSFLADAAETSPLIQLAVLDALAPLATPARSLFTRTTVALLLDRVPTAASSSDELTKSDIRRIRRTLRPADLPSRIPFAPSELHLIATGLAEHLESLIGAQEHASLDAWLQRVEFLEDAGAIASREKGEVVELQLVNGATSIRPVADLLSSFEALLGAAGRLLSPRADAVTLTPLSAATGSFSFRAVSRGRTADKKALDLTHHLLLHADDIDHLKEALGDDHETWKRLKSYLDQVARQDGEVETALYSGSVDNWRRVTRVRPDSAEQTARRIAEHADTSTRTLRDRGRFIAANMRQGTFTAKLDKHGEVDGTAMDPAALNRVSLGRPYAFRLEASYVQRLLGDQTTYTLNKLDREEDADDGVDIEKGDRPVGKGDVPQAKLERALQVAELISEGKRPTPKLVGVKAQRNVDYYLHAARLLGLLDRENRITSVGRLAFSEDQDERMLRIALKFEEMTVAEEWVAWAGKSRLAEVDPASAADFLAARSSLRQGTIDTRAGYLRKWHKLFSPYWSAKRQVST